MFATQVMTRTVEVTGVVFDRVGGPAREVVAVTVVGRETFEAE